MLLLRRVRSFLALLMSQQVVMYQNPQRNGFGKLSVCTYHIPSLGPELEDMIASILLWLEKKRNLTNLGGEGGP